MQQRQKRVGPDRLASEYRRLCAAVVEEIAYGRLDATMNAITVPEFAARQGVTRQAVDKWIAATPGLTLRKLGRARILTAADCRRILARPGKKMGRPKKVVDTAQPAA